eukprot:TRINITY_DN428_c1_g1_i1.p1 TRINITY_DN428_c1_g1~~TRINITY_DN428_c1_g1_i1.p1  ORF type:complete len:657 (-),score=115.43 TRINITY_DN428_c1_g1_i1:71-2041(-)
MSSQVSSDGYLQGFLASLVPDEMHSEIHNENGSDRDIKVAYQLMRWIPTVIRSVCFEDQDREMLDVNQTDLYRIWKGCIVGDATDHRKIKMKKPKQDPDPDVVVDEKLTMWNSMGAISEGKLTRAYRVERKVFELVKSILTRKECTPLDCHMIFLSLCWSFGVQARLVFVARTLPPTATSSKSRLSHTPEKVKEISGKKKTREWKGKSPESKLKEKEDDRDELWIELHNHTTQKRMRLNIMKGTLNKYINPVSHDKPYPYVLSVGKLDIEDCTRRYEKKPAGGQSLKIMKGDDAFWIDNTLAFFYEGTKKEETVQIDHQKEVDKFTSQALFKRDKTYVLEKDILTYMEVHPREPVAVFKTINVYLRENLYLLHSIDKWLQNGREVKAGEQPLKRVKSRANALHGVKKTKKKQEKELDSLRIGPSVPDEDDDDFGMNQEDQSEEKEKDTIGLYGIWQTEVFKAVPPKDGRISRNRFGNIYLFKPEMLPEGTTFLTEPGLGKTARKLGIDWSAAQTGWEYQGRRAFPAFGGIVVCSEFKDSLLLAYEEEKATSEQNRLDKIRKNAMARWNKFAKALQVVRRLSDADAVGSSRTATNKIKGKNSDEENRDYLEDDYTTVSHQHTFNSADNFVDPDTGVASQKCSTWGLVTELEEELRTI